MCKRGSPFCVRQLRSAAAQQGYDAVKLAAAGNTFEMAIQIVIVDGFYLY